MSTMTSTDINSKMGLAHDADTTTSYMQRARALYLALGYGSPCRRVHYIEVSFQPLNKRPAEATVTLITTAAPYQPDKGNQGPGVAFSATAKLYTVNSSDMTQERARLARRHRPQARKHRRQQRLVRAARICAAGTARSPRLAFLRSADEPRSAPHREVDCPRILRRCHEGGVDAALRRLQLSNGNKVMKLTVFPPLSTLAIIDFIFDETNSKRGGAIFKKCQI